MFEPVDPSPKATASRAVHLALAAVVGIALVGFAVGIRQGTPIPELVSPVINSDPASNGVFTIAATSYSDFDRRNFSPNRDWISNLKDLPQPDGDPQDYVEPAVPNVIDETERLIFLAQRMQRRAYDGAPPIVPHPIDQMSSTSCLACHQNGLSVGHGVYAPAMSHPVYANCTQCHAEGISTEFAHQPFAENRATGLWAQAGGSRAYLGAPPTIPHPTWMRENCMSCHGATGASPIKTSHPWRVSCTQCHAPSSEYDQVFTLPVGR